MTIIIENQYKIKLHIVDEHGNESTDWSERRAFGATAKGAVSDWKLDHDHDFHRCDNSVCEIVGVEQITR